MTSKLAFISKCLALSVIGLMALGSTAASAGSQHLKCPKSAGFKKVATHTNAIKCRMIRYANSRREAHTLSKRMMRNGTCNAHSSPVTIRVIPIGNKPGAQRFKVQGAFTCAKIS